MRTRFVGTHTGTGLGQWEIIDGPTEWIGLIVRPGSAVDGGGLCARYPATHECAGMVRVHGEELAAALGDGHPAVRSSRNLTGNAIARMESSGRVLAQILRDERRF